VQGGESCQPKPANGREKKMKKVFQTKFEKEGNCFVACLASILEISIEKIPEYKDGNGIWYKKYRKWLNQWGLDLIALTDWSGEAKEYIPLVFAIVSGISPRGLSHSVVYFGHEMIHDPHPEGGGVKDITDWIYIVSKYPKRVCDDVNCSG
jgi:hypothetical protein